MVKSPVGGPVEFIGYQHQDHLGTTFLQTDSQGMVIWEGEYSPFGELTSTPVNFSPYPPIDRLPGMYKDWAETGLDYYYNGYRWYDPSTGRYLGSEDIEYSFLVEYYSYAKNNPIISFDYFGLVPQRIGCPKCNNYNWEQTWNSLCIDIHNYDWGGLYRKPGNCTYRKCLNIKKVKCIKCSKNILGFVIPNTYPDIIYQCQNIDSAYCLKRFMFHELMQFCFSYLGKEESQHDQMVQHEDKLYPRCYFATID